MTVTLGVYADEYCSEYIGGDVTAYLDNVYYNDNIGLYVNSPYGKYISMNSMYNSKFGAMTNLFDGGEESYCMSCEAVEVSYCFVKWYSLIYVAAHFSCRLCLIYHICRTKMTGSPRLMTPTIKNR